MNVRFIVHHLPDDTVLVRRGAPVEHRPPRWAKPPASRVDALRDAWRALTGRDLPTSWISLSPRCIGDEDGLIVQKLELTSRIPGLLATDGWEWVPVQDAPHPLLPTTTDVTPATATVPMVRQLCAAPTRALLRGPIGDAFLRWGEAHTRYVDFWFRTPPEYALRAHQETLGAVMCRTDRPRVWSWGIGCLRVDVSGDRVTHSAHPRAEALDVARDFEQYVTLLEGYTPPRVREHPDPLITAVRDV